MIMATTNGFPDIDTTEFEEALSPSDRRRFRADRHRFVRLVQRLIVELALQGHLDHLNVGVPAQGRAELYRRREAPWPSKRLCLDLYSDRYMDARLLRHELGHEADRRNPEMLYDPAAELRWKGGTQWALDVAANISLDARLGDGGLGREWRLQEFRRFFGSEHDSVFDRAWRNPPRTWPEAVPQFAAGHGEVLWMRCYGP
jgi:hypothetical protein